MGAKRILFDAEARAAVRRGAETLTRAVRVTLGPRGRLALLGKSWGAPSATKDGVSVAKEIELPDPYENMGAQLLKDVAAKVSKDAGDGTTAATVMADAILAEGLRHLGSGANVAALKRGIDKAVAAAVEALKQRARPVKDAADYRRVATIAANGDAALGEIVGQVLERFRASGFDPKDGAIVVEDGKSLDTEVEYVEGMEFDRGWLSAHFVTDPTNRRAELANARILVHEKKISAAVDLLPLLEQVAREGVPLVVIAEEVEGEALAMMVVNRLRGIVQCVAVKAPGFGDRRKEMLEDIAVCTGAAAVMEGLGRKLESVNLSELGRADRVVIGAESTQIIGGGGDRTAIQGRCAVIRKAIEDAKSDYDREKLEERLAKLAGGVAKILVGGATESEMKSRKQLVENAIKSTRAAADEGLVAGGGTALLRCEAAVDGVDLAGDERLGAQAVRAALSAPLRAIARNAGENPELIAERVRTAGGDQGFDAAARVVTDMTAAGIIDPLKVVRSGLEHAASAGGMLLSLEAAIAEAPDESK